MLKRLRDTLSPFCGRKTSARPGKNTTTELHAASRAISLSPYRDVNTNKVQIPNVMPIQIRLLLDYEVTWYNTTTGKPLPLETHDPCADGTLKFTAPDFLYDIAGIALIT